MKDENGIKINPDELEKGMIETISDLSEDDSYSSDELPLN